MTKDRPRNMAASVRQRLMNIARQQRERGLGHQVVRGMYDRQE